MIVGGGYGYGRALGAQGYGFAYDVTTEEHQGGGHFGGDWYRHYKHPGSHKKKKPIAADIREMYEAMIEVAPAVELAKINSVIIEYVEKPSANSVNLSVLVKPPAIDWVALANDLENVYALARIYDRLLEYEDEAAFLLLM
jgi:hypothetical protein